MQHQKMQSITCKKEKKKRDKMSSLRVFSKIKMSLNEENGGNGRRTTTENLSDRYVLKLKTVFQALVDATAKYTIMTFNIKKEKERKK